MEERFFTNEGGSTNFDMKLGNPIVKGKVLLDPEKEINRKLEKSGTYSKFMALSLEVSFRIE